MNPFSPMAHLLRALIVFGTLAVARVVGAAEPDVTLFRIFMLDGKTFVSYGEFVRLDENVVFSMPVGGAPDQPRLQVAMVQSPLNLQAAGRVMERARRLTRRATDAPLRSPRISLCFV